MRRAPIWPGWKPNSLGYHGDDGNLYLGAGLPASPHKKQAQPFANGDVVGCGYDPMNGQVFWTVNGALIAHCASDVPTRQYYPCVALRGQATSVELNFGSKPFRFELSSWQPKAESDECKPISVTPYFEGNVDSGTPEDGSDDG